MASVTKRGSKWSIRYRVTNASGVTTMKRISGFNSKEEAWERARELERMSNAGIDVHGANMTCGQLMERWFAEHCVNGLAATTLAKYSAGIDRLSTLPIYELPIKRVNAQTQTDLIRALCDGLTTGRPISMRTAISHLEPLRLSLSWAVKHGFIAHNPLAVASLPKTPKRPQRILNDKDINDLQAATIGQAFRIPLLLGLYGGLRRGECAGLRWGNVDFDRRAITIVDSTTRTASGRVVYKETKTDPSRRTISMPAFVMDELKAAPKRSEFVCVSRNGEPFMLDSYPQAVRRIIQKINKHRQGTATPPMPQATFHDLRHTHAAMLIKMGIQPKVIQERLGHASIKITMDLYGYLMTGLQEAVADALDAQFRQGPSGHKSGHTQKLTIDNTSTSKPSNETKETARTN